MEQSQSITKLAAALVKVQSALSPIPRTSVNPFFKSKYADLEAIWSGCRKVLTTNGLAIIQAPSVGTGDTISVATMLVHESGEWVRDCAVYPLVKNDPQGAGSAITYGRRYGLSAILGMVTEDDDDGHAASAPARSAPAPRAAASTPAQSNTAATAPAASEGKTYPIGGKEYTFVYHGACKACGRDKGDKGKLRVDTETGRCYECIKTGNVVQASPDFMNDDPGPGDVPPEFA
jgi:hypothetical protein